MPQPSSEPAVTPEASVAPDAPAASADGPETAGAPGAAEAPEADGGPGTDSPSTDVPGTDIPSTADAPEAVAYVVGPRVWGVFPRADVETRAVLRRDAVPVTLGALLAVAVLAVRDGLSPLLPAHAAFAVLAAALTALDLRLRRLPDALTLPAYPVLLVLLALPGDGSALLRALLAALALTACYYALAFFGGAGFGDVKAAGSVGLVLGYLGWRAVLGGTLYASLLAGVLAVALLLARRASRRTQIPFGPFMMVGALLALLLQP